MKSKWRSKTFWVGALSLTAGLLGYTAGHEVLAGQEQVLAALIGIQGAVHIILRFMTTQPIK
jgi:hypothetical protein